MKQMLIGGKYDLLHSTNTEYNTIVGAHNWYETSWPVEKLISTAGTIKNLRVKLNDSPGAGKSYAFTLLLNGSPTGLTFSIADTATSGSDATSVAVVAGDLVNLRCIPTGTPTARYAAWTSIFEGTIANESIITASQSDDTLSNTQIRYARLMGQTGFTSTEDSVRSICPTAGTIKNLYVKLTEDPGTSPDAYRFTLRKGGASQSLTVTITADNTTGNDTANSFSVAAGDVLTLMVEPLNSPSVSPSATWGMTFVADTDGESIILSGIASDLDVAATEYQYLTTLMIWVATESERYQLGQSCVLKKLYILLSGSPGSSKNYNFTIRIGVADSNVVAIVSSSDTTGNSGALEDTVANDDYLSLQCVPTGTPTARQAFWGLVSYIDPSPPIVAVGGSPLATMIAEGII